MFGIGQGEILIIFLVILLVFGARRIPDMAQGLGRGIKEFRKAVREVHEEIDLSAPPPRQPVAAPPPQSSVAQRVEAPTMPAPAPKTVPQAPAMPAPETAPTTPENQYS
jgi:sec-independent protein translocase protein TatA